MAAGKISVDASWITFIRYFELSFPALVGGYQSVGAPKRIFADRGKMTFGVT